jgi:hypothetical protein
MTKESQSEVPSEHVPLPTAPELPHHVAKEYGVHDLGHTAVDHAADTTDAQRDPLLDDAETDQAVDDITARESDALLELDAPAAPVAVPLKRGFWAACKRPFTWWWRHKWLRYITVIIIVTALATIAALPVTRYAVLNAVGVRSRASVIAVDQVSKMPLKNVRVTLAGKTVKTDVDGKAVFGNLRLGPTTLTVKRVAFAPVTEKVTVGWGSNPLGSYALTATGIQYPLLIVDYLSEKPVQGAEVVSDEANALADKKGNATITVDDTFDTTLPVTIQAAGYRTENLVLDAEASTPSKVLLVPAAKHAFVVKQNGKYDAYATDLDGKNRQLLLAGTGLENSNIGIAANHTGSRVALTSTRDNARDKDGYLLTTLTSIDTKTGTKTMVERGAQVQLLSWMGDRLVYRIAVAGASAANPGRYRIMSYNAVTNAKLQLASANEFTVSSTIRGFVYFAASSTDPKASMGLYRIKPDGTAKKQLFNKEIWTAIRMTYDAYVLQTPEEWYSYDLPSETVTTSTVPTAFADYAYSNNSNESASVFLDKPAGKTALILYDIKSTKKRTLVSQDGIVQPLHWAGDNAVVYRMAIGDETADYAISPDGGSPRKIADVFVTYGASSP